MLKDFLVTLVLSVVLTSAKIIPEEIHVPEGDGFLLRVHPTLSGPIQTCQLTRNNRVYSFPVDRNDSLTTDDGEDLLPFLDQENGECGVRVFNVSAKSSGHWTLTWTKEDGSVRVEMAQVSVKSKDRSSNQKPFTNVFETPSGNPVFQCSIARTIQSCRIQHLPTGKKIEFGEGMQNDNYSAYRTNLKQGASV